MRMVLIETSGNQRYIFATNRLRENVGASELTYRAGTEFVLDAVKAETGVDLYEEDETALRANLLDRQLNPALEAGDAAHGVEVIVATSGKAILLVREDETARRVISRVTRRALESAPGLSVHGVVSDEFEITATDVDGINRLVKQVHERLEHIRFVVPGAESRFLRLPFVAPCETSGYPAREEVEFKAEQRTIDRSAVTLGKLRVDQDGLARMKNVAERGETNIHLSSNIDKLERTFERELSWLAVVHADGNGFGEIFLNLKDHVGATSARDYLNKYRELSLALDACTVNAFKFASRELRARMDERAARENKKPKDVLPVIPLVLGGDDLTVICDGRFAVQFTHDFLSQFERETEKPVKLTEHQTTTIIADVAASAFNARRLGICAGVAITKPHFPFHTAYELAASLLRSAKIVKERVTRRAERGGGEGSEAKSPVMIPCSALDFFVLHDTSGVRLEQIRLRQRVGRDTYLYVRPYIVTPVEKLNASGPSAGAQSGNGAPPSADALDAFRRWLEPRMWRELETRVAAMLEERDGERRLPNSMLHALREQLYGGRFKTDASMRLVKERYKTFNCLLASKDSLFWRTPESLDQKGERDSTRYETNFLDALDLIDFWIK